MWYKNNTHCVYNHYFGTADNAKWKISLFLNCICNML